MTRSIRWSYWPAGSVAAIVFLLYTRLSDLRLENLQLQPIDPAGLSLLMQVVLVGLAVVVFARQTLPGRARHLVANRGPWIAILLYAAVLCASSLWSPDRGAAEEQAASLLKNVLLVYLIVEMCATPGAQRAAIRALLAAGTLMAAVSIFQAVTHTFTNSYLGLAQAEILHIVGLDNSFRGGGPIGDPNFYALVLTALLPMALLAVRDEVGRVARAAALLCALIMLAAIVLTYSRGALVALGIVAVLFIPLVRVPRLVVVAGLALLIPVVALVPANYRERLAASTLTDTTIQSRIGSQAVALAIFADHPGLGTGAASYESVYGTYVASLGVARAAEQPHNSYLEVAAETGLAGFLPFVGGLLLILYRAWRRRAAALRCGDRVSEGLATACLLALLAYLIGIAFLPLAYPRYLWMLAALTMAVALPAPRSDHVT